ncbi:hypothetical protein N5P37_008492, partial [Trichoderma harzianum]
GAIFSQGTGNGAFEDDGKNSEDRAEYWGFLLAVACLQQEKFNGITLSALRPHSPPIVLFSHPKSPFVFSPQSVPRAAPTHGRACMRGHDKNAPVGAHWTKATSSFVIEYLYTVRGLAQEGGVLQPAIYDLPNPETHTRRPPSKKSWL